MSTPEAEQVPLQQQQQTDEYKRLLDQQSRENQQQMCIGCAVICFILIVLLAFIGLLIAITATQAFNNETCASFSDLSSNQQLVVSSCSNAENILLDGECFPQFIDTGVTICGVAIFTGGTSIAPLVNFTGCQVSAATCDFGCTCPTGLGCIRSVSTNSGSSSEQLGFACTPPPPEPEPGIDAGLCTSFDPTTVFNQDIVSGCNQITPFAGVCSPSLVCEISFFSSDTPFTADIDPDVVRLITSCPCSSANAACVCAAPTGQFCTRIVQGSADDVQPLLANFACIQTDDITSAHGVRLQSSGGRHAHRRHKLKN